MSSREEAERDGVQVPLTLEDYTRASKPKPEEPPVDLTDFYDDFDPDDDDDEDEEDEDEDGRVSNGEHDDSTGDSFYSPGEGSRQ